MKVLISEKELQERVTELAEMVSVDYRDKNPALICVLKGAVFFLADLSRRLDFDLEMDFMAVSSYGPSTDSSGVVRILKDLDMNIEYEFVVGYGLDYAERYRILPYIAVLDASEEQMA